MDKRATRQITLYSILFLVMLMFSGITFFLGLNYGVDKTEQKYAHLRVDNSKIENYSYQQQDLVTFYLTTYTAYEEFQTDWFESITAISTNRVSNPANVFDELASSAKKRAVDAGSINMEGYGLLDTAQKSYIRSLNYFEDAAKDLKSKTAKKTAAEAMTIITNDDNYKIAIEQALKAQASYFNAMHLWTVSIDPNISNEYSNDITQPISNWNSYPLITKMNIIANNLNDQKIYKNVLPQDIVSRIDEFIANGQAQQLSLTKVNEILELLLTTDAIRQGDYQQYKGNRYNEEFLPNIPFFNAY